VPQIMPDFCPRNQVCNTVNIKLAFRLFR